MGFNMSAAMLCAVVILTGCQPESKNLVSNVILYYEEFGAPKEIESAIISGYLVQAEDNTFLCDTNECVYNIKVLLGVEYNNCIGSIVGTRVTLHGSLRRGILTDVYGIFSVPDNQHLCFE